MTTKLLIKESPYPFSFLINFRSEEACRLHFKSIRDKLGIKCKCGNTDHYWIKSRWSYQCKKCKKRMTLKSGTLLQNSKLSILTWYKTIFLLTIIKDNFNNKEIQHIIGLKRYEPVWSMVNKLKKSLYTKTIITTLKEIVDVNKSYFSIEEGDIKMKNIDNNNMLSPKIVYKKHSLDNQQFNIDISSFIRLKIVENRNLPNTPKFVEIVIEDSKKYIINNNCKKPKVNKLELYLSKFAKKLNTKYFEDNVFEEIIIKNILII